MKQKRIIWLYPKLTTWMGGVRFVFEVLVVLARRYEVLLVVQRHDSEVVKIFEEAGIRVLSLNTPSFTEIRFWTGFFWNIKQAVHRIKTIVRPDDVLVSAMFPMSYIAKFFDNRHAQIIYEPFAMFHDRLYQKSYPWPVYLFCRLVSVFFSQFDKKAVQASSVVLALSHYEKDKIERTYGRIADVVCEGVKVDHFYPKQNEALQRQYSGSKIVFHSTGYDSFKGTDLLIEAVPLVARKVKDVKFLISHTRINQQKLSHYLDFLTREGVRDRVEFLGFLDYTLLPDMYTLAQVYVEPGVGRSMSLSSKEANACGTPSIRGKVGTEDVVDGKTGYLVDPFDKEELAKRIVELVENTERRESMGRQAREMVLKEYTWDAVAMRIEHHLTTT